MLHEGKVGSITHTVDMNGSIRNEYDYDTFGTRSHIKTANSGSNQHFGYTGEMYDAESGLLYLRARYYDPTIGRFISADPYLGRMAEPVTQNRYIYVHNNPLLFVDPSGLCSVLDTYTPWIDCIFYSFGIDADQINAGASFVGTDYSSVIWKKGEGMFPEQGDVHFGVSTTLVGAGVSLIYNTDFQASTIAKGDEIDMTIGFNKYLSFGSNDALNKTSVNLGLGIGLPLSFGKELGVFDISQEEIGSCPDT